MTVSMSMVGNRWRCKKFLRKVARSKDYGMVDDVKLQRIGMFVWHLRFDVETKI